MSSARIVSDSIPESKKETHMSILSGSPQLLERLLDQMIPLTVPVLEDDSPIQNSKLLDLPTNVLQLVVTHIPLKQRLLYVATVCRRLRECVRATVTSIEFYKEGLDNLKDNSLMYFISLYAEHTKCLNFDLFRSTYIEQCTQWAWRQSVVSCISLCPKLEALTVLVCNRHRLRDNDLIKIFKQAPCLKAVSADAQFLKGHCLQSLPLSLEKLELEVCSRIQAHVVKYIYKLKHLKVLCLSQLLCLKDSIIEGIASYLQSLEDVAIILHGEHIVLPDLTSTGLAAIARLPLLKNLALEGVPQVVTDAFLQSISDVFKPLHRSLESLSLAFCNDFSSTGFQYLARFPLLADLNIEGCVGRDLSDGLLSIATRLNLKRLLVSETCCISSVALLRTVQTSRQLRLLDITGNPNFITWEFALALVTVLNAESRLKLTVLTDTYVPWNLIAHPNPTAPLVEVVHVLPSTIPPQLWPNSVLSIDAPSRLPPGTMPVKLRKGIRCRLLCTTLALTLSDDEKENSPLNPSPEYSGSSGANGPTTSCYASICEKPSFHSNENIPPIDADCYKRGGAPRPPILIPEQPTNICQYTRGPRSKRRSAGVKTKAPPVREVCFTDSDFPPLGSS